jgi:Domain of unknown function (DUF4282)
MPEPNGMVEGLMDFSFRRYATPRMLEFLYAIHLLAGLIAGVGWVVLAFQQGPVQGLLALLGALVGYFDIFCGFSTVASHSRCSQPCFA